MTLILDATAGYRMMWFEKNNADTVYFDIRREVKPTVVGDFRALPFRDEVFDLVVFDPPHTQPAMSGIFYRKFGALRTSLIIPTLYKASKELFRVLKTDHFLFSNGALTRCDLTESLLPFPFGRYLGNAQLEKSRFSQAIQVTLSGFAFKKQTVKSDFETAPKRVSAKPTQCFSHHTKTDEFSFLSPFQHQVKKAGTCGETVFQNSNREGGMDK